MKSLNANAFLLVLLSSCSAGQVSLGSIEEFSFSADKSTLLLNEEATITISGGVAPYTINSTQNQELWSQDPSNNNIFKLNYNIWEAKPNPIPFQVIDSIGQILNSSFTLLPSAYNFSGAGTSITTPKDFVIDSNGDLIVAGETNGNLGDQFGTKGSQDIYLAKIKQNGKLEWSIQIGADGTTTQTFIQKISITLGNEIIILGHTDGDLYTNVAPPPFVGSLYGTPVSGNQDAFIMKISSSGEPTWSSQFDSGASITPTTLSTSGTDIILSGYTDGDLYTNIAPPPFVGKLYGTEAPGNTDAFVMKISSSGEPTWSSQFDSGASITPTTLNISGTNIILSGYTYGDLYTTPTPPALDFNGEFYGAVDITNQDAFIMKISSGGEPDWTSQFDCGLSYIWPVSLSVLGNDIILSGYTDGDLYTTHPPPALDVNGTLHGAEVIGNEDAFVMKISEANGSPTWTSQFDGGNSPGFVKPVSLNITGTDIILSGYTDGDLYTTPPPPALDFNGELYGTSGAKDAFVMKISSSTGAPNWTSQIGGGYDNTTPIPLFSNTEPVSLKIKDNLSGYDILLSGFSNGNLYTDTELNGTLYGSRGSQDAFVVKISETDGAPTWTSQLGTTGANLTKQSLAISNDFLYIFGESSGAHLAGASNITTLGSTNSFLVKFNSQGAQQ